MSIGIYKITSPNNKIYVEQSINIEKRFNGYKRVLYCKNQIKLYNSFVKYGTNLHIFEILEICSKDKLNEKERYWQNYYNVINGGLNLKLTKSDDEPYVISNDTKEKTKESLIKYFNSLTIEKKSEIYGKSSRKRKGVAGTKGRIVSEETRNKISKSNTKHAVSIETKDKIRNAMKDRKITWGNKISKSNMGRYRDKSIGTKPILQHTICDEFIKEWKSIREASDELQVTFNSISNNLLGYCKTSGGFIWKYKNKEEYDKKIKRFI